MRTHPLVFSGVVLSVVAAAALFQQSLAQPQSRQDKTSIQAYGAVGDGKADDTAAIQAAVNAGLGEIRFARGVYRITRPIVIELDKTGPTSISGTGTARIVMAGAGPAFKFIGTHEGTASPKTVKENVWQRQRTPMVDGIEIVGGHPEAEGLWFEGTMQPTITRVVVRKAKHGIHLFRRDRNVIVSECHLYENSGVGLYLDQLNLHQINVTNCHISYNGGGGIVVRQSEIRNIHIGTCDIEGNHAAEGPATANILFDCTQGSVREGAVVGCTIQHTHEALGSANIRFLGNAEQPLKVGHMCIADNAMSDVQVNIHLKYARGVTITGNTLWKAFEQNLLVEGSSNIVLGPNLLDRNPEYKPHDSPNAVIFADSTDCTIQGLHVNNVLSSEAGVVLRHCQRFNVNGCTLLNCDARGMLVDQCEAVRVSDCLIQDTRAEGRAPVSLEVRGGGGITVSQNLLGQPLQVQQGVAHVEGNTQL